MPSETAADSPAQAPAGPARSGHARFRNFLLVSALLMPIAGIAALLVAFHPFASAAGGCGGG